MGKLIVLGSIWKRAFAHLFDLATTFALASLIYFPFIMPLVSNGDQYNQNSVDIALRQQESGLFFNFNGRSVDVSSPLEKLDDFSKTNVTYFGETKTVYLLDNLKEFYCGETATKFYMSKISSDVFNKDILGLGSEKSSFSSIVLEESHLKLVKKENVREYDAVIEIRDKFNVAINKVNNDPLITRYSNDNMSIIAYTACYAIPPIIGSAFIFFLLVPLFSKTRATFGKKIFKLTLLDKNGYTYPKPYLVLRFFSYLIIELFGTMFSFGSTLLVSYTMTMFTKKHRCIHDYISNSVVADEENSLYFDNVEEEKRYEKRHQDDQL